MDVTLPFEKLDYALRHCNPLSRGILPLRLRVQVEDLTKVEKRNLREFANIEDGIIERYILVPANITVGALEFAIDKSFGLVPGFYDALTLFDESDMARLFPTFGDVFDNIGVIFDDPYTNDLFDRYLMAVEENGLISGPFYPTRLNLDKSSQKRIREVLKEKIEGVTNYQGKEINLLSIPYSMDNFFTYIIDAIDKEEDSFAIALSPDLVVKGLLAEKSDRLSTLKAYNKYLKCYLGEGKPADLKPIARKLLSYRYNQDGSYAFTFEVDIPDSLDFIIEDGYMETEEYIESAIYVNNSFLPDCIYKSGYDLYGRDSSDYYNFIMSLHSGLPPFFLDILKATGWREPNLDYKKILRD